MNQVRRKVMIQKTVFMKTLLRNFNAKVRRENILKPAIGNESVHQNSNDNSVTVVKFATSKNLVVMSKMFPHQNIHTYTWTSLMGRLTTRLIKY
jgi:hypothetical protein